MSTLFRFIAGFFKGIYFFFSFVRSLFFNLLFLALVLLVVYSLLQEKELVLKDKTILKLSISGNIVEQQTQEDPVSDFAGRWLGFSEEPRETVLQDILDALRQAKDDPKIEAILLDLKYLGTIGLNQLETIGEALIDFRQSGKQIISAEDYYSQDQYYLAAHADSIFLNPMGGVNLHGFGLYRFYFKEALEKLKVDFHVFQVGSYKSALEPITRNSMSAEDRSQSRAWLSALWKNYTEDVAEQRNLKPEAIDSYINAIPANLQQVDGNTAALALDSGLVDELKTRQQIRTYLEALAGSNPGDELNMISLAGYLDHVQPSYFASDPDQDKVALIVGQGTIVSGTSRPGTIGADSISTLLRRAKNESDVKAVVLRVDSGGGSAFASELIRQEIRELKKSGKPVFISMGAYAASGGYWISADADEIWASANTLTGSIGIFMALPTFDNLLQSGGIHRDGVGTTNLAAGLDLSRPLSAEVSKAIELVLQDGYDRFISVVAEGRSLPREKVEELAQGKVYSGSSAREIGLVDNLGSLEQTIAAAAERAGLADYQVTTLLPPLTWRDRILLKLGAESRSLAANNSFLKPFFKAAAPALSIVQEFLLSPDPNGIYAHCMINYSL